MKTYKTYQEAKIANPTESIYKSDEGEFGIPSNFPDFTLLYADINPADYCMTVEQFLKNGYKFVVGDVCINQECGVEEILKPSSWNSPSEKDNLRYVLRAASLEKQPRMKEVYEKVDCKSIAFWECAKEYQSKMHIYWKDSKGKYVIQDLEQLVQQYKTGVIYRKVEKPIEWWEDAAEHVNKNDSIGGAKFEDGKLIVDASFSRDQWCDFARILLEQEGE